jgi:adenosylcobinamide kinase/adenosylcobinamide-phosphate guanylyltransferase
LRGGCAPSRYALPLNIVGESKRGETPLSKHFPLSFILPRKERGIKGVRLRWGEVEKDTDGGKYLKSTLIIGGARSGKSTCAQEMASKSGGNVLFVATAEAGDEEMRRRIEKHRDARPPGWTTLEATTHIGRRITKNIGKAQTVIIDCITLLINNVFQQHGDADAARLEKAVMAEVTRLFDCIDRTDAHFIIVTNEVGLGIVPADEESRLYRDLLGKVNQRLAGHADEVYLLVAGIPIAVKTKY